ncbi:MAG: class I SAM-dependent methyltransferase [Deltaproteobacteria bacterium]|nr:class I SAM-dependent methyltransferase [Deltaproteobacteria bacterium]
MMRACPLCLKSSEARRTGVFGEYAMYLCAECGVEYSDPFKGPGPAWYEDSGTYGAGRVITKRPEWYHREALAALAPGGSLLDVGCGTGIFLNEARRRGFDAWGIDFDKNNIAVARSRYGLDRVYCMSAADLMLKSGGIRFDAVTFFEVLEHLDAPAGFLDGLKGLLRPGGLIAMSVPNRDRFIDTLGQGDSPPNHLTRWSAEGLRAFLERSGFEVVRLHEKRADHVEVRNYLLARVRLGLAHGLVKKGLEGGDHRSIAKAGYLMAVKDALFGAMAHPPGAFLRLLGLKGGGIVALARLKGAR